MFRTKIYLLMVTLSLVVLLAGACTSKQPPITAQGGPVRDYISLIDSLRAAGATVEPAGEVTQPFFSVKGLVITVNDGDVQVFEYAGAAAAEAEAALVSPDGSSIGTSMVNWVAPPHFYQEGKLVVLYVGDSGAVTEALESVLGQQFAGRLQQITVPESQRSAEEFVRNSPTFLFDGIEETLKLADTLTTRRPYSWTFIFNFDSRQAGYGDRTGRMLAQVITSHQAVITVEQLEIISAVMDDKWDMISQQSISSGVEPGTGVTEGEADFIGWITEIHPISKKGIPGQILVESQADKLVDKYVVTITDETLLFRQDGEKRYRIAFDDLETTQQAQIWFSGPILESFPMKATAQQVVVVKNARNGTQVEQTEP